MIQTFPLLIFVNIHGTRIIIGIICTGSCAVSDCGLITVFSTGTNCQSICIYGKGSYSAGWRYLEAAAPNDQYASPIRWDNGTSVTTGATATAIGTGDSNTTTIVSIKGVGTYPAKLCADYSIGSYSDWFLPSKDELTQMYVNLISFNVGNFANTYYWSSSEISATNAWRQGGSIQYDVGKNFLSRVRAARTF